MPPKPVAEADLEDDRPAAAGMVAVRRAEAAGCSPFAPALAGDAARAAATGKSAEHRRAEVELRHEDEDWLSRVAEAEDELRAAGVWPWGVP